jgi:uncharacterized protein (TIGR02996 family)
MHNDEAFLRAIADNPADKDLRLVYADWLDEQDDPRAEFLRVQEAFRQQPTDKSTYLKLCEQERKLIRKLDPSWVQRVRRYTTAAPCRSMAKLVPDLAPYARTTTRLHPHRATGTLPVWASKIGGRFLWPMTERWPSCDQCKVDLAPIVQLRKSDVPDIAFPPGTDLLQLYWCPDEAAHGYQPAPQIWWRTETAVADPRTDDPDLSRFPRTSDWEGYTPFECAVYPERVVEYPDADELHQLAGTKKASRILGLIEDMDLGETSDLKERFASEPGPSDAQGLAFYELGRCPGSRVGGKPGWRRDGLQFEHLLTLSTWEFDAASFRRWLAVEDQRLLAAPSKQLTWECLSEAPAFGSLQEVLGMQLGRTQRAHVYVCRKRKPWRVAAYVND